MSSSLKFDYDCDVCLCSNVIGGWYLLNNWINAAKNGAACRNTSHTGSHTKNASFAASTCFTVMPIFTIIVALSSISTCHSRSFQCLQYISASACNKVRLIQVLRQYHVLYHFWKHSST